MDEGKCRIRDVTGTYIVAADDKVAPWNKVEGGKLRDRSDESNLISRWWNFSHGPIRRLPMAGVPLLESQ